MMQQEEKRDEGFYEIMDAIMRLRIAFKKNGYEAPVSIELGHYRDKDRFLATAPRELLLAQPRMHDDPQQAEWVCNVQGIELRLPAQWRIELDGKKYLT